MNRNQKVIMDNIIKYTDPTSNIPPGIMDPGDFKSKKRDWDSSNTYTGFNQKGKIITNGSITFRSYEEQENFEANSE